MIQAVVQTDSETRDSGASRRRDRHTATERLTEGQTDGTTDTGQMAEQTDTTQTAGATDRH